MKGRLCRPFDAHGPLEEHVHFANELIEGGAVQVVSLSFEDANCHVWTAVLARNIHISYVEGPAVVKIELLER